MSSSKEYVQYVLDCLSHLGDVRVRAMMGEYVLYYRDKIPGGIYDDCLLLKDIPSAKRLLADAPLKVPYDGAKPMLLVEDVENREQMREVFEAMWDELPEPKKRKRRPPRTDA